MDHSISKVVFAVALSAVALGQNACTDDSTTGGTPTPSEASCSSDSDCTGDMQCIANTCSTRLRNGSACSSNDMCLSGKCADGVCALIDLDPNPDPSVVKCNSNGDCASGYCVGNVCNERVGADCVGAADCGDGLSCRGLKCTIVVDEGGACASHSAYYCRIGTCIDGTCKLTQQFVDSDGDTIADIYEGRNFENDSLSRDTDGDGVPDYLDLDSDGDTIPDSIEAGNEGNPAIEPIDSDGDTLPDFQDPDSDGNGIPDSFEGCRNPELAYQDGAWPKPDKNNPDHLCAEPIDTDGNGVADFQDFDNDGDGANDNIEIAGFTVVVGNEVVAGRHCDGVPCAFGTPETPWDADGDTIPDYLSTDSDGDTIPDVIESYYDSNDDGILDRYSLDSDGDTIPDGAERDAEGNLLTYTSPEGLVTYCFRSRDCDGDGVPDDEEPNCGGVSSINRPDADGDGYPDASEIAAGKYAIVHGLLDGRTISSVFDIVCNPNLTVKDVFDFYFELPYQGDSKDDILEFIPKVSKLDLVFNVDTTASMTEAIENVKTNIGNTIDRVRKIVPDTGFALTNFDDYPVGVTAVPAVIKNSAGTIIANAFYQMHGNATAGDLPFRVLGKVSTDAEVVTSYTQKSLFTTRHGEDGAESGAESLYQIATGVGTAWRANSATGYWLIGVHPDGTGAVDRITKNWNGGSTQANVNAPSTWGGVDFRQSSLPVVVHTTDVYSHDAASIYNSSIPEHLSYNRVVDSVVDPHYTADLVPVLRSKGIRVITLGVPSNGEDCHANDLGQMTTWSRESDAVVPACAFEGACGANKCCLGTKVSDPVTIGEKTDQCVLYYEAAQSDVSETVTKGVAALVKYGTYEVSTRVEGEPIAGSSKTTACFIKRVVATKYLPPPQEPEKSCNPTALPKKLNGADYDNGFENFAPGTANPNVDGARLHFTVVAQNDDCVEPTDQFQIFKAYIDVINPTTGLVFGRRQVSILVPPKALDVVN